MKLIKIACWFIVLVCAPQTTQAAGIIDQAKQVAEKAVQTYQNISQAMTPQRAPIPDDKIINLVLMGKTGAGKSTFINTFYNFAKKTKADDFPKHLPIKTKFAPLIFS